MKSAEVDEQAVRDNLNFIKGRVSGWSDAVDECVNKCEKGAKRAHNQAAYWGRNRDTQKQNDFLVAKKTLFAMSDGLRKLREEG